MIFVGTCSGCGTDLYEPKDKPFTPTGSGTGIWQPKLFDSCGSCKRGSSFVEAWAVARGQFQTMTPQEVYMCVISGDHARMNLGEYSVERS